MNTYIKPIFFCVIIFFSIHSLVAQELGDLQGTWINENVQSAKTSRAGSNLDSLVFTDQNYKLYSSIDSLNQKGKFMLQNTFLALFPSSNENQMYQFDLDLDQDQLSLEGQLGSYNLAKTSIVKETNVEISENLGFSFESFYRGMIGVIFILAFAFLLSKDRKNIDWKLVAVGLSLQILFALGVLKVGFIASIFEGISEGIVTFLNTSEAGAEFLFGSLIDDTSSIGYIFAFKVLPTIIFFSAFTSVLYYLGILQKVVYVFAWVMSKTMRLSGAESLAAAANIFIGQTEAPLVVKPYLEKMTKSELLCLMVGGMATIAGGVLAAFIGFLGGDDVSQQILFTKHLLTASIMSAPAAIVIAKMLYPESKELNVDRSLNVSKDKIGSNILDAISKGTIDGLKLAVNVGAMLLVFTALIAVFNWFLGDLIGDATGLNGVITDYTDGRYTSFSLQYILGNLFAPIAWIIGVPVDDIVLIGQLLGEKTILNEFIAYGSLKDLKVAGKILNQKSIVIATYALCGFANFASIGIQIGGIGVLAPGQRKNLAAFGIKALIGGTCAALLTATIAGMLFG